MNEVHMKLLAVFYMDHNGVRNVTVLRYDK